MQLLLPSCGFRNANTDLMDPPTPPLPLAVHMLPGGWRPVQQWHQLHPGPAHHQLRHDLLRGARQPAAGGHLLASPGSRHQRQQQPAERHSPARTTSSSSSGSSSDGGVASGLSPGSGRGATHTTQARFARQAYGPTLGRAERAGQSGWKGAQLRGKQGSCSGRPAASRAGSLGAAALAGSSSSWFSP